jgi:Dephospho-CoA kinase
LVLKRIQDIEESVKQKHGEYQCHTFVIVEAAVLLDTNWDEENDLFDAIWLVRASADTRCERLVEKRGMERQDALSRLEAQLRRRGMGNWKEELDRGAITAVIENEGFMGAQLWQEIKKCLTDPECWKRERNPPLFVVDWTKFL